MDLHWKNLTPVQKVLSVLSTLLVAGAAVTFYFEQIKDHVFFMDLTQLLLGISSLFQVPVSWKANRKVAYLELAAGVILIASSILSIYAK